MTGPKHLKGAPSSLPLFAKAALGAIPGSGTLPFLAGGGGELPDTELALDAIEIDSGHLARYCDVCSFTLRDTLPVTYPHVLAFPLHMALLTDSSFPFPAIGLVHIANEITQHRPLGTAERLSLKVGVGDLAPHPKGRTFRIRTEARVGDELVWEGLSTNLRRGSGGDGANADDGLPDVELRPAAEWKLPGDLGRSYAGVSGDRNPIHLYGLTAKAFGFPRQIAHGMWSKARCLAALEGRLGDSFTVSVAFKRPILLPGKVEFALGEDAGRIAFGLRSPDGTPHLQGRA